MHDERDRLLGALYRRTSGEEPPARLDRAVMAQASQALRRRSLLPFGGRRVAIAALALACLAGVLLVLQQQGAQLPDLPVQGAAAPPAEQPGGRASPGSPADIPPLSPEALPAASVPPVQRFDFYPELPQAAPEAASQPPLPAYSLPEPRVDIPGTSQGERPGADAAAQRLAGRSDSYLLQLAGYRSLAEAGRMQDKLEFMRLNVHMQQIPGEAGEAYYTLGVGPYSDPQELERVQGLLKRRGIETTRVRVQQ